MKNRKIISGAVYPLLFGHRGYSKIAPENTLASFKTCFERNIPGIELDVHLCKSGELVVIHDYNLKRTTGMDAVVENTDYKTISSLDAGRFFSKKFKGEKVPLLSEVFDLLGTNVYYDIEIKHKLKKPEILETKLLELIEKYKLKDRCLISSFNPFAIGKIKDLKKETITALIYSNDKEVPPVLRHGEGRFISGCSILKPDKEKINKWSMFFNRTLSGYQIMPWVVDEIDEAEKLLKLGISGLISNDPGKLIDIVSNYQQ